MIGFLNRLCSGFLGIIAAPLCRIVDAIKAVWRLLMAFFRIIRLEWGRYGSSIRSLFGNLALYTTQIESALWRIITRTVPNAIGRFWKWAWKQVVRLGEIMRNHLMRVINGLKALLLRMIDIVWRFLKPFADWITKRVGTLFTWLFKVGFRIADLVLHPVKLVTWILPHVLSPLLKFLIARRFAIGRWFLNAALRFTLSTANVIESVLVRIL